MLDGNIMVSNAEHDESVFRHALLLHVFIGELAYKLVLNQNQSLHGVLQGQFVLAHLGKDSADVQVDVAWVADLQAVLDCLLTEVEVVVFDLKCFLEVGKCRSKLLCSPEDAGKVVVCHCPVTVSFFC